MIYSSSFRPIRITQRCKNIFYVMLSKLLTIHTFVEICKVRYSSQYLNDEGVSEGQHQFKCS